MTATCYPTPRSVAQDMLQGVVQAICDRPGQTAAQRDALSRGVVHTVMALQPRDAVEVMFAGLIVTHFHLILGSARELLSGGPEVSRPRATSGIVSLGRAMGTYVKEFRLARERPMQIESLAGDKSAKAAEAEAPPPAQQKPEAVHDTAMKDPGSKGPVAVPPGMPRSTDAALTVPPRVVPPSRDSRVSVAAMQAVTSPPVGPILGRSSVPGPATPRNHRNGGDAGLADVAAALRRAVDHMESVGEPVGEPAVPAAGDPGRNQSGGSNRR